MSILVLLYLEKTYSKSLILISSVAWFHITKGYSCYWFRQGEKDDGCKTTCLLNQNSIPIIILIRWEILDILLSTHTFCNSAILAIIVEHVLKIVTALPLVLTLKTWKKTQHRSLIHFIAYGVYDFGYFFLT
jgi:hypothetical protein